MSRYDSEGRRWSFTRRRPDVEAGVAARAAAKWAEREGRDPEAEPGVIAARQRAEQAAYIRSSFGRSLKGL